MKENLNKERISIIAIIVNFFLSIFKITAGILSRSSAVIAEGIHSGMDIITSIISFVGIKAAKKPVDEKHPYGHYKMEVFAGLIITIFLMGTSFWIIYDAITSFFTVKDISISYVTLIIMAVSAVVNEIMARATSRLIYTLPYYSLSKDFYTKLELVVINRALGGTRAHTP